LGEVYLQRTRSASGQLSIMSEETTPGVTTIIRAAVPTILQGSDYNYQSCCTYNTAGVTTIIRAAVPTILQG